MKSSTDIILAEIGDIKRVVSSACSIESTLRGRAVDPTDLAVQLRAAEIILAGAGARIRAMTDCESAPFTTGSLC